ncbi:hypothetical protein H0H81_004122 [Sphagnurus paluster]|uniref:HNH nuclease domain-containing protein n=1 Tax=Sphagnurus paluster TaxID=117069 RepID=A0A9P7GNT4_9AGAR|nr:hypothetical protein H0H81_004122 [Sphagnurus paluster]
MPRSRDQDPFQKTPSDSGNDQPDIDPDYQPGQSDGDEEIDLETTPSCRTGLTQTYLPSAVKNRVKLATDDLDGLRCIICNTDPEYSVQYSHILARKTKSKVLDVLELAWGMDYRTLNSDSRYNIMRLSAELHGLYDKGWWFLLPERHVLEEFAEPKDPVHKILDVREIPRVFNYTFVASTYMRNFPLRRISVAGPELDHTKLEHHTYPFTTLPVIKSHVHPRFIIFHIGHSFHAYGNLEPPKEGFQEPEIAFRTKEQQDLFAMITDIYTSWFNTVPDPAPLKKSRRKKVIHEDRTEETRVPEFSRRLNKRRRRNETEEEESPTRSKGTSSVAFASSTS